MVGLLPHSFLIWNLFAERLIWRIMAAFLRTNTSRVPSNIISEFPIRFSNYWEPFLSSGEIFFNLFNNGRIFEKAYLASSNKNLINAYRAVKDEPERLQNMILKYCENNSKQFYENMKFCEHSASAYIYLNRAMNKDGKWRESQFIDKNREISKDVSDIQVCSNYLNRWCGGIYNHDWETTLTPFNGLQPGDLVWLEPPRNSFTIDARIDYVTNGFNESSQIYLNNFMLQLKKKGVHIYLINSDVPSSTRIFGAPKKVFHDSKEALWIY